MFFPRRFNKVEESKNPSELEKKIENEKILAKKESTLKEIEKISDDFERKTLHNIIENYDYKKDFLSFYLDWQDRVMTLYISNVKIEDPSVFSKFSHISKFSLSGTNIKI